MTKTFSLDINQKNFVIKVSRLLTIMTTTFSIVDPQENISLYFKIKIAEEQSFKL